MIPSAGGAIADAAASDDAAAAAKTPELGRVTATLEPVGAAALTPGVTLPLVRAPGTADPLHQPIASAAAPSLALSQVGHDPAGLGRLAPAPQPQAEPRGVIEPVVKAPFVPLARDGAVQASVGETSVADPEPLLAHKAETAAAREAGTQPASAVRIVAVADPRPLPPARIAAAGQIFAAAIQRAVRDERRPAGAEPTPGILAAPADLATRTVTALEGSRHGALDMARETWPAKMIERIELLRDAADAADTSIRLVPDRLGAIDVSLRKDGDGIQVQFTAQQAETRHLLAEAQPKLADMAEARGLRLSLHTGDGGGQQNQHQPRAASPQPSSAPGSAEAEDEGIAADGRVA